LGQWASLDLLALASSKKFLKTYWNTRKTDLAAKKGEYLSTAGNAGKLAEEHSGDHADMT
jgi:hypothetical protein